MKTFLCVVLLAAAALAAPEGQRDKRGILHGGYLGSSYHSGYLGSGYHGGYLSSGYHGGYLGSGYHGGYLSSGYHGYHGHSYSAPIISHSSHIVTVPKVVAVKKIVSVPHVHHYSYAPSYSSGWW